MNAGAIALQAADQRHVPQRMLPIHHGAEKLSGNRFQLSLGSMLEIHFAHVAAEIKFGDHIPSWEGQDRRARARRA